MTTTTDRTIGLGRLCSEGAERAGLRHRLLYMREHDMVVMPYARAHSGWECVAVATRLPRQVGHLTLTDEQLAEGFGRVPAEPDRDPDGYARLAWLSQAFLHWPGGAMLAFAHHIVDDLRLARTRNVLAAALADHPAIASRLPNTRPVAVGRLIDKLVIAGLLTRAADYLWQLTLPEPHGGG